MNYFEFLQSKNVDVDKMAHFLTKVGDGYVNIALGTKNVRYVDKEGIKQVLLEEAKDENGNPFKL